MAARKKEQDAVTFERALDSIPGSQTLADDEDIAGYFDTGLVPLNVALTGSCKIGLPYGRIVEIYGNPNVGKTTLGIGMLRECQRAGGCAIMIDTEGSFTPVRAKQLGIDASTVRRNSSPYLEDILNYILAVVTAARDTEYHKPIAIFFDTLAAAEVYRSRGKQIGESTVAEHARIMSAGLRRINPVLKETRTTLLVCNQLKAGNLTNPFASEREKDGTVGGEALKFYGHSRIKFEHTSELYSVKKKHIGFRGKAKIVKNKAGAPDDVRFAFLYTRNGTFDNAHSCLMTMENWGAIKRGSAIVELGGEKIKRAEVVRMYNSGDVEVIELLHKMIESAYETRQSERDNLSAYDE